jgi:hypothetical protein
MVFMHSSRLGLLGSVATSVILPAVLLSCGSGNRGDTASHGEVVVNLPSEAAIDEALASITEEELTGYIEVLASDEFGGRAPASPGETRTIQYLTEQFASLGLEPGGENGTWVQEVPLVAITADAVMTLSVASGGGSASFAYGTDLVAWTTRVAEQVWVESSEMVFAGYGVVAPEYGWDDYAGLDVTGKTVVVLVNDPGFATQDPDFFRGNAMTYYGRWTYKFEEGARQGASAVLIVHETAPAAYGWNTVQNTWTGTQFNLVAEDNNMGRVAMEGWWRGWITTS